MPSSSMAGHQKGEVDLIEDLPIETKIMREKMDAVDKNLDKMKSSLQRRFSKIVSSQINRLREKEGDTYRSQHNPIEYREMREEDADTNQRKEVEKTDLDLAKAGLERGINNDKPIGITRIRIRQFKNFETDNNGISDGNKGESTGSRHIYPKVTIRQYIRRTSNEIPTVDDLEDTDRDAEAIEKGQRSFESSQYDVNSLLTDSYVSQTNRSIERDIKSHELERMESPNTNKTSLQCYKFQENSTKGSDISTFGMDGHRHAHENENSTASFGISRYSPANRLNGLDSPVGRKLKEMVEELEDYNESVSPRMDQIKQSLSPKKPNWDDYDMPAVKYYNDKTMDTEDLHELFLENLENSYSNKRMIKTEAPSEQSIPIYHDNPLVKTEDDFHRQNDKRKLTFYKTEDIETKRDILGDISPSREPYINSFNPLKDRRPRKMKKDNQKSASSSPTSDYKTDTYESDKKDTFERVDADVIDSRFSNNTCETCLCKNTSAQSTNEFGMAQKSKTSDKTGDKTTSAYSKTVSGNEISEQNDSGIVENESKYLQNNLTEQTKFSLLPQASSSMSTPKAYQKWNLRTLKKKEAPIQKETTLIKEMDSQKECQEPVYKIPLQTLATKGNEKPERVKGRHPKQVTISEDPRLVATDKRVALQNQFLESVNRSENLMLATKDGLEAAEERYQVLNDRNEIPTLSAEKEPGAILRRNQFHVNRDVAETYLTKGESEQQQNRGQIIQPVFRSDDPTMSNQSEPKATEEKYQEQKKEIELIEMSTKSVDIQERFHDPIYRRETPSLDLKKEPVLIQEQDRFPSYKCDAKMSPSEEKPYVSKRRYKIPVHNDEASKPSTKQQMMKRQFFLPDNEDVAQILSSDAEPVKVPVLAHVIKPLAKHDDYQVPNPKNEGPKISKNEHVTTRDQYIVPYNKSNDQIPLFKENPVALQDNYKEPDQKYKTPTISFEKETGAIQKRYLMPVHKSQDSTFLFKEEESVAVKEKRQMQENKNISPTILSKGKIKARQERYPVPVYKKEAPVLFLKDELGAKQDNFQQPDHVYKAPRIPIKKEDSMIRERYEELSDKSDVSNVASEEEPKHILEGYKAHKNIVPRIWGKEKPLRTQRYLVPADKSEKQGLLNKNQPEVIRDRYQLPETEANSMSTKEEQEIMQRQFQTPVHKFMVPTMPAEENSNAIQTQYQVPINKSEAPMPSSKKIAFATQGQFHPSMPSTKQYLAKPTSKTKDETYALKSNDKTMSSEQNQYALIDNRNRKKQDEFDYQEKERYETMKDVRNRQNDQVELALPMQPFETKKSQQYLPAKNDVDAFTDQFERTFDKRESTTPLQNQKIRKKFRELIDERKKSRTPAERYIQRNDQSETKGSHPKDTWIKTIQEQVKATDGNRVVKKLPFSRYESIKTISQNECQEDTKMPEHSHQNRNIEPGIITDFYRGPYNAANLIPFEKEQKNPDEKRYKREPEEKVDDHIRTSGSVRLQRSLEENSHFPMNSEESTFQQHSIEGLCKVKNDTKPDHQIMKQSSHPTRRANAENMHLPDNVNDFHSNKGNLSNITEDGRSNIQQIKERLFPSEIFQRSDIVSQSNFESPAGKKRHALDNEHQQLKDESYNLIIPTQKKRKEVSPGKVVHDPRDIKKSISSEDMDDKFVNRNKIPLVTKRFQAQIPFTNGKSEEREGLYQLSVQKKEGSTLSTKENLVEMQSRYRKPVEMDYKMKKDKPHTAVFKMPNNLLKTKKEYMPLESLSEEKMQVMRERFRPTIDKIEYPMSQIQDESQNEYVPNNNSFQKSYNKIDPNKTPSEQNEADAEGEQFREEHGRKVKALFLIDGKNKTTEDKFITFRKPKITSDAKQYLTKPMAKTRDETHAGKSQDKMMISEQNINLPRNYRNRTKQNERDDQTAFVGNDRFESIKDLYQCKNDKEELALPMQPFETKKFQQHLPTKSDAVAFTEQFDRTFDKRESTTPLHKQTIRRKLRDVIDEIKKNQTPAEHYMLKDGQKEIKGSYPKSTKIKMIQDRVMSADGNRIVRKLPFSRNESGKAKRDFESQEATKISEYSYQNSNNEPDITTDYYRPNDATKFRNFEKEDNRLKMKPIEKRYKREADENVDDYIRTPGSVRLQKSFEENSHFPTNCKESTFQHESYKNLYEDKNDTKSDRQIMGHITHPTRRANAENINIPDSFKDFRSYKGNLRNVKEDCRSNIQQIKEIHFPEEIFQRSTIVSKSNFETPTENKGRGFDDKYQQLKDDNYNPIMKTQKKKNEAGPDNVGHETREIKRRIFSEDLDDKVVHRTKTPLVDKLVKHLLSIKGGTTNKATVEDIKYGKTKEATDQTKSKGLNNYQSKKMPYIYSATKDRNLPVTYNNIKIDQRHFKQDENSQDISPVIESSEIPKQYNINYDGKVVQSNQLIREDDADADLDGKMKYQIKRQQKANDPFFRDANINDDFQQSDLLQRKNKAEKILRAEQRPRHRTSEDRYKQYNQGKEILNPEQQRMNLIGQTLGKVYSHRKQREDANRYEKQHYANQTLETSSHNSIGSQTAILNEEAKLSTNEQYSQTKVHIRPDHIDDFENKTFEQYNDKKSQGKFRRRNTDNTSDGSEEYGRKESVSQKYEGRIRSADSEFNTFILEALPKNVHRLQDDIERVLSTKDLTHISSSEADENAAYDVGAIDSEADDILLARIETLLSICDSLDEFELKETLKQLLCSLQHACFDHEGLPRDHIFMEEMKLALSGLKELTENDGSLEERLFENEIGASYNEVLGTKTVAFGTRSSACNEVSSHKPNNQMLISDQSYDKSSRRQFLNVEHPVIFERQREFLKNNLHIIVLGLGISTGIAIVLLGPSAARTIYNFIFSWIMYIICNVRIIQPNPPIT